MKKLEIKVENLSDKSFEPYGAVIEPKASKPTFSNSDLNLWFGIDDIKLNSGVAQICWLEVKSRRPFVCDKLECHMNCSETIIPMSGQSIIVVGLFKGKPGYDSLPDINSIEAFFIDGTKGVNLKPGVWHWLPYPLSGKAHFALVLKKGTPEEDLRIVDLNKELSMSIKLVL